MQCPKCNAVNRDDAKWCALCFARFNEPEPVASQGRVPESPAPMGLEKSEGTEIQSGPLVQRGEITTWACPSCGNENPMTDNSCLVCGTSFYSAFGPTPRREAGTTGNPVTAALLSAIPGAGHFYLKRTPEGLVRIFLGAWWFLVALFLPPATGPLLGVKIVFALAALGLVGISMVEAYQNAENPEASPILDRRLILWSSIALFGLLMIGGITSALAAT